VPGQAGQGAAFAGELLISFLLMTAVLAASSAPSISRFTGLIAATLVAAFITFEAPFSGMSMNPARTFGPSLVGGVGSGLWIYFVAPPLGTMAAAEAYVRVRGRRAVSCAKLRHDRGPCLFCAASVRA
jgi:aquaporin Z